ncbi:MerR family transcriptional regulator [Pseudoalteromonas luteoviolacea]|uniref:HTH merR-type domain-containing protein n=1 Tax=Pseudoalteromonas luteoviolacea DSM 6061 TaxID=1365250 RepID=A0A166WUP0_9GAMM|nr:MerR family transcriptional regulator [Pseudoalteromonas luteoviolacea]KZN38099.1 hypothetical protein N475_15840 [Pseudoalteromonas luteoviolacea DSM 6061]MBE0388880.1 hypothetical protein [Pseudoalteromonas luteoviolacea DSM 6061]
MFKISELAKLVGMSRTALLYYKKQGLISSKRLENGYRIYTQKELQRVRLIQQLLAGGLTLSECKACIDTKIDRQLLKSRLSALDTEIKIKQQSRNLLSAMLGEGELKTWHEELNKIAPDAHLDWLIKQGFDEKEALKLKWLSKDINVHDTYISDFMEAIQPLELWAPGSREDTLEALKNVPKSIASILEIGCGKGHATQTLATHSAAHITAVDSEQSALNVLQENFERLGLSERLTIDCISMTTLEYPIESFDLIWAEGSAYIMGVINALRSWKPLLSKQGMLVFSDLVWYTNSPSKRVKAFWLQEYPDMKTVSERAIQIKESGYRLVDHFPQSELAWKNYYGPLERRVKVLKSNGKKSKALQNLEFEIEISKQNKNSFGYHFFVLSK